MSHDNGSPPVACNLTTEQEAERSDEIRRTLVSHYRGVEERDDGYVYRFEGTDEALEAIAGFTAAELRCCAFADYTIEVSPPYEETRLTITGPEGTKEVFGDLVHHLEAGTT